MNEFKENETFYSEKGRQFPDEFVSFFLFLFSNQDRFRSGLAVLQCSSSTFFGNSQKNLRGNDCDRSHFQQSLSYSKWTQSGRLSISFPNTFLWLLPSIQQRIIKDLSKSGNAFYLKPRNTQARDLFILFTRKIYVFSEMHSSQKKKKKKSMKLKRFLGIDKSSQNFLKSLV